MARNRPRTLRPHSTDVEHLANAVLSVPAARSRFRVARKKQDKVELMESSHEQLKVAVIGVGALGRHHARILAGLPQVELVAVADPNADMGQSVAEACGCDWTPDYRTLLRSIDAASVVVPTKAHFSVCSELLCRDIPLLVEKPLASTAAEGAELVRLATEHDLTFQVGHIERFNPAFQQLEQQVDGPKYIRAERLSPYAFRSMDIGAVHDLMIHDIELVLRLVGETPDRVEAFGATLVGGWEDVAQARLVFPSGCVADLTANRVCPGPKRWMQVWSERGVTDVDLGARKLTSFEPGRLLQQGQLPFELAMESPERIPDLKERIFGEFIATSEADGGAADALTAELSSFVDAVLARQPAVVDGQQGLRALQVAEQIVTAIEAHAWDGKTDGRVGPLAWLNEIAGLARPAATEARRAA